MIGKYTGLAFAWAGAQVPVTDFKLLNHSGSLDTECKKKQPLPTAVAAFNVFVM